MTTAAERMVTGFKEGDEARKGKPPRGVAEAWRHDGQLERAAKLLDSGGRLSPQMRMSVGHYVAAKKLAAEAGIDTSGPA